MPLVPTKINKRKVGFFRFKEMNNEYLITNDIGDYSFLSAENFNAFLSGKIEQDFDKYQELQEKGFIWDRLDFQDLTKRFLFKNSFLCHGPGLHIVVVTLRCDHRCLYCQSNAQGLSRKLYDMDTSVARAVVDRIFESPNKNINIEFQGGEPLVNFKTVKFIIEYAKSKNKEKDKKLEFLLVSNFSFMTREKLDFLIENKVSFCSSLDGPESLHNKNRVLAGANSYKNTIKWLKEIQKEIKKNKRYKYRINALATITKSSLSYPKEIIDEYMRLGLQGIHLRPVNPFGVNKKIWSKIVFHAGEFIGFYKKALDYILELNLKGKEFHERTAKILLTKILTSRDPNFLDTRSPCGAGIGQLAYNFNGDVYSCDEGRMLSVIGDESFRVGNVMKNSFNEFMDNEIVKSLCLASCLDNVPGCESCVYKPYCGVCPIYNYYVEDRDLFFPSMKNDRCRINMAILDYLFDKLRDARNKEIFYNWIHHYSREGER